MVVEARETLKVGGATAESINAAIKTLDEFVRSVAKTNTSANATNERPFDVLDYATAAGQIGAAAKELNALLVSANDSASRLAAIRDHTAAGANAIVDHAFMRARTLILLAVLSAFFAGILYRMIAARLRNHSPAPSDQSP